MRRRALLAVLFAPAPAPARAFRLEEASAEVKASWNARCEGGGAGDGGESRLCPLCGCALTGEAADHGERR